MDEKRHFGMWLSRRALNRQAKALRDVTSAALQNNTDLAPMIGQTHACIQRSDLLEALPRHCGGSSLIRNARRIFGATFIVLGVSASLSPALAAINEERSNTDAGAFEYIHDTFQKKLVIHFLVDDYDGLTEDNLAAEYKFLENDFYGLD